MYQDLEKKTRRFSVTRKREGKDKEKTRKRKEALDVGVSLVGLVSLLRKTKEEQLAFLLKDTWCLFF